MERYSIKRHKQFDLEFEGTVVGSGSAGFGGQEEDERSWTYGTAVTIWVTRGGQFAVHVKQWSPKWRESSNRAHIVGSPAQVVAWLHGDARGPLGEASILAIEDAAEKYPAFEDVLESSELLLA